MKRTTLVILLVAGSLFAISLPVALGGSATRSKTVETLPTMNIYRGTFTLRARRLSPRRIRVRMILTVGAKKATQASFTVWPCRRVRGGGVACAESDKIGVAFALSKGQNNVRRRVTATRNHRGRAHCAFAQAHDLGANGRILHAEREGKQGVLICGLPQPART
jgi:hypothetical protein